ncbi:replication initiator [Pseudonocardia sp. WMMC193]|uniref:replication initiator n=1 Tax=Pseudonocardia sp. WMMC193 TaxID=2911965 RepID=UPI001F1CDB02|nr:replication initiator [Pseudonocardia sp. WMMC193]MCF7551809.1 replication initiation protein [Pseudonocardia sp. WMMC193]
MSDLDLTTRLRGFDYPAWRARMEATGGCAHPVRLRGSSTITTTDGTVLTQRSGEVWAPCGNRRETVCPACSDRYAADAFHLIRAGLSGKERGIPATVTDRPRAFLTLTAPSFGPVHTRRLTTRGKVIPCACGEYHREPDPRLGGAIDHDSYDYVGAVLWQAHAGKLWARFAIALRRALAARLGVSGREFGKIARLSYAKVAEYQRRGLVHFHAAIRIDGPDGPADPPPAGLTAEALHDAVREAAAATVLDVVRPDGTALALRWGAQLDLREITPTAHDAVTDEHGEITDSRLAGYIAKYATKGTGKTDGHPDRPIRSLAHLEQLSLAEHHRRLIETAWHLGGLDAYRELNLRKWAHMLGFRGHFLTKSRAYSTTFRVIRGERRAWRLTEQLAELGHPADEPVIVVNTWALVGIGHHTDTDRELAIAHAERIREQRRTTRGTS